MAKTSEARAKVSLDSSSFEKGAAAVTRAANAMSAAVTTAFAAAGVAIVAALGADSVRAATSSAKAVVTLGESMANAGHKAGIAAGQFYLLNTALEKGLSFKDTASLIGENAEVLDRAASTFRDVSIKLWAVGERIRGFWLGLMERVTPVLSRLLDGALAHSLVEAGQMFGDKLADAVKVVYQLAEDGALWETMKAGFALAFDYAGERLLWLAGVGGEVLRMSFADAFSGGISDGAATAWDTAKDFASSIGEAIANAFYDAWTVVLVQVNKVLDALDYYTSPFDHGEGSDYAERSKMRDAQITERLIVTAGNSPVQEGQGNSWLEKVQSIFEKNAFEPSKDLAQQIESFGSMLTGALDRYDVGTANDPTRTFDNNTRRVTPNADSLASIGGGGNVYLGLSVLDVNRRQLDELREINRKMDRNNPAETLPIGSPTANAAYGISRNQRSSVMEGTR